MNTPFKLLTALLRRTRRLGDAKVLPLTPPVRSTETADPARLYLKPDPAYFPECIIRLDHDIRGLLRNLCAPMGPWLSRPVWSQQLKIKT